MRLAHFLSKLGLPDGSAEHMQRYLTQATRYAELCPNDADAFYDLACAAALLVMPDLALASLARAVGLGYRDADWALEDADLASLRTDLRFTELIDRMRREE